MQCDARCWTPVDCARCGKRKEPHGRSVPLEAASGYCDWECPGYDLDPKAPHLWDEHDSTRHYTDPDGWLAHVATCARCRGDE